MTLIPEPPPPPEMTSPPPPPAPPGPPAPPETPRPRSRRNLWFLVGGIVVVAAAAGGIAWALTAGDGPGGGPGGGAGAIPATAEVVPADAQVFASFDTEAGPDMQQLMTAFAGADPTALGEDLGLGEDGMLGDLGGAEQTLACLEENLNLGTDATSPAWIGNEVGVALLDMEIDPATGDPVGASILVTLEVTDPAAAGAALPEIVAGLDACGDESFQETTYQGVTVYRAEGLLAGEPTSLAVSGGHLFVGVGEGIMEQALDTPDGESLADDPAFAEVLAALPADSDFTAYLSVGLLESIMESATQGASESGTLQATGFDMAEIMAGFQGFGLAGTFTDDGVRLDMVSVTEPGTAIAAPPSAASSLPASLPAEAIGFLGTGPFDVPAAWDNLQEMLAEMPTAEGQPGLEETLSLMEFMLGIDLEQDLIGQLTGEMGIGLLPSSEGILAEENGVSLGVIAVLGVKNPAAMAGTMESMAQGMAAMSGTPAEPRPFEGGTLYALGDGTTGTMLFGMAGDDLVLTTGEDLAVALLAGGPKLAESPRYLEALSGLPDGGFPVLYLDVAALVTALNLPPEDAAGLAPLQTVVMSASGNATISRTTVFARIDY